MALQPFTNEQLNYFKFAFVVLNEFPKVLRQTFKQMWDNTFAPLPGYQPWDDSITVRNMFLATEGGKTKVPTRLPYEEWDCTALFKATIYAKSFALPDATGYHRTLSDLYLEHRIPPDGTFHCSVLSPGGNDAETFAMAIDQLRLLRNACFHSPISEIDRKTFDQYIQHTKDAVKALGVRTDPIDAVGSLSESDFPTEKVSKLKDDITKELLTEVRFLKENVEDELMGMRSDLAQSRQERQEDSLELRKTIEKATANQEVTNEKITEMNQKFENLLKTERPVSEDVPDTLVADISQLMPRHWKLVAAYLGLTHDHVTTIDVENDSVLEKVTAMLNNWKQKQTKDATRRNLMKALVRAGRKDLAEKVCSYEG